MRVSRLVFVETRLIASLYALKRSIQTRNIPFAAIHQEQQHQGEYRHDYQYFNDPLFPEHSF